MTLIASPASVEASGTIELKEMESVIGELFEMSGVSRGEGETRAVRSVQHYPHVLLSSFWSRFVSWCWFLVSVLVPIWHLQHIWEVGYKRRRRVGRGRVHRRMPRWLRAGPSSQWIQSITFLPSSDIFSWWCSKKYFSIMFNTAGFSPVHGIFPWLIS